PSQYGNRRRQQRGHLLFLRDEIAFCDRWRLFAGQRPDDIRLYNRQFQVYRGFGSTAKPAFNSLRQRSACPMSIANANDGMHTELQYQLWRSARHEQPRWRTAWNTLLPKSIAVPNRG